MGQKTYGYNTPVGIPGGIYDLNDYISNTRINEEKDGKLLFGVGVIIGSEAGNEVALPVEGATAAQFEGVVMNTGTTEMDKYGKVAIPERATVGIMSRGRIWARVSEDAIPEYGKTLYLIIEGDNAGFFTTAEDEATKIALNARFISSNTSDGIAAAELFGGVVSETIATNA